MLAWHLHWLGRKVLLIDRAEAVTSSKIAAGIITPITGKRVTLSQGIDVFLPEALECYQRTAAELGAAHFHPLPQVRLFQNDAEKISFETRRPQPEFARHLTSLQPGPLVNPQLIHAPHEGFEMSASGWLDTRSWLKASAAWFADRGQFATAEINPAGISLGPEGVDAQGYKGGAIVFCEGYQGAANPWFPWVKWKSAKGEILTLSCPALRSEKRILNRGGWLLPVDGAGTFRCGATYAWDDLSSVPTISARKVLESRLGKFLRVPWEVTDHQAAVRPIIHQSLAKMGRHPSNPALVFFNGLGSKGVLHGPRYARMLAEHLVRGTPLDNALDVAGND